MPVEYIDHEARAQARDAVIATGALRELFDEKLNGIQIQYSEIVRRLGVIDGQLSSDRKEITGWKERLYIGFIGALFTCSGFLFVRVMGWA